MKLYTLIPSAVLFAAAVTLGALHAATVASGGLIKGSLPAVYYIGADGNRYVFPNDKTYFSWYADFSGVNTVTDAQLAAYPIGGNVTYRPGTRLVKIQSDPKVYAVDDHGVLRWVKSEAAAIAIWGSNWNKQVDDISDSFFVNYTVGADINSASDFSPAAAQAAASTINEDKQLLAVAPVNSNTNANSNTNSNTNTNINNNTNAPTTACTPECSLGNACVANQCQTVPGPSAMKVTAFIVDYADVCFVGDPCISTSGSCCSVDGNQFADNTDLKAINPTNKYLYADKQQLCGKATVSALDKSRISQELDDFAASVDAQTSNRMSVSVNKVDISGNFTLSRVPGTCNWWMSPDDLRDSLANQVDYTTDAVFVIGSRDFDFGNVSEPDSNTVDQTLGLGGAGYTYINKEWETDTSGAPDYSMYSSAFAAQMNSSLDLGISNPNASYIGNHCRDGKQDFDETGVDCGGVDCNACVY
jgi:hypothetical protein